MGCDRLSCMYTYICAIWSLKYRYENIDHIYIHIGDCPQFDCCIYQYHNIITDNKPFSRLWQNISQRKKGNYEQQLTKYIHSLVAMKQFSLIQPVASTFLPILLSLCYHCKDKIKFGLTSCHIIHKMATLLGIWLNMLLLMMKLVFYLIPRAQLPKVQPTPRKRECALQVCH